MKSVGKKHSNTMISIYRNKKERRKGVVFAAPFLTGLLVFSILPFLEMFLNTFFHGGLGGTFAGVDYYKKVWISEAFQRAFVNTFLLLLISLIGIYGIGILLALFLKSLKDQAGLLVTFSLLPYLLPALGTVMIVKRICPDSIWSLLLIHLWKYGGFYGVLLYMAMNRVPKEYEEAAALEGAGYWVKVRLVLLPCIREMIGFTMVMGVVNCFLCYREALLLGGTHPDRKMYLLQHYLSNNFEQMNLMHLSVAAVTIVFVTLVILGLVSGVREHE